MNYHNASDIKRLMESLSNSTETVIVTHMKPDGDAVGSSVGAYHFIKSVLKKDAAMVMNDRYPGFLDFLTDEDTRKDMVIYAEDSSRAEDLIANADTIICLDFNAFHRTDNLAPLLESSKAFKILIDHHLYPESEKFDIVFSVPGISSTCELVYQILMESEQTGNDATKLPAGCATALMTGMTTDTNNFANSVFPSTLIMASELIAAGVDRDKILENLFNCHSENRLRLMGHMMKDLLKITADGVAYIILDKATQQAYNIAEGDTEGFVNMPLSIKDVRISMLLKEDTDRIRVSIRSKKGTSANALARLYFNGGGHENAAGGKLMIPVGDVEDYVRKHTHLYIVEDENRR